jgi:hypothetical protein
MRPVGVTEASNLRSVYQRGQLPRRAPAGGNYILDGGVKKEVCQVPLSAVGRFH